MNSPKRSSKMSDIEDDEVGAEAAAGSAAVAFEGGVAELVVGRALLGVLEDLVGFVDLFEFLFGVGVLRISVRMMLLGETAEGGFQLRFGGAPLDAQYVVIIALGHKIVIQSRRRVRPPIGRHGQCAPSKRIPLTSRPEPCLEASGGTSCRRVGGQGSVIGSSEVRPDFFLSSLTSSKSASTTLSPPPARLPSWPCGGSSVPPASAASLLAP